MRFVDEQRCLGDTFEVRAAAALVLCGWDQLEYPHHVSGSQTSLGWPGTSRRGMVTASDVYSDARTRPGSGLWALGSTEGLRR